MTTDGLEGIKYLSRSNGRRLTIGIRPFRVLARRSVIPLTSGTGCARSMRVTPKTIVNESASRAISAHDGIYLGIKRAPPSLTESKRGKDRSGIA
jgi:hypothetical protein